MKRVSDGNEGQTRWKRDWMKGRGDTDPYDRYIIKPRMDFHDGWSISITHMDMERCKASDAVKIKSSHVVT